MTIEPNPTLAVSVLTASFNGAEVLGRQMDALAAQVTSFAWEYVVVDNGSSDGTRAMVESRIATFPVPLRLVDGSARRNIPFVRNLGVAAARADLVVFCDQDDIVQPGWLQAAHDALQENVAVMGQMRSMVPEGDQLPVINSSSMNGGHVIIETCNFGIRKEVLLKVGGFDEGLPAYGMDDSELNVRLQKAGYSVAPIPEMELLVQPSVGVRSRIKKIYGSSQAEIYVWRKHEDVFGDRLNWAHVAREGMNAVKGLGRLVARRGNETADPVARRLVTVLGHAVALRNVQRGGRWHGQ